MSTSQLTKLQLFSANPALFPYDLPSIDWAAIDMQGLVNNIGGYAVGDSVISIDSFSASIPTSCIIKFDSHNDFYYVSSGGLTSVTIAPKLSSAISDNEIIYIYPHYDVSDFAIEASSLIDEIEVTQNELVLPKQVSIKLFNPDDVIYDRITYKEIFDAASALFTTRNNQESQNYKYVKISCYIESEDIWVQMYAGQIIRDELVVNEPKGEIRFLCESVYYGLQDIKFGDIDGVYYSTKYSDINYPSRTIQGRYFDLIPLIFHAIGIPKKVLSITSREKNSGQCKIGFTTDPEIIAGEYIEIDSSLGVDYAGKFRCDGIETISGVYYIYYHSGTNTVAINNTDETDVVTAHRVYFDRLENFISFQRKSWDYSLEDCFFMVPDWSDETVSEMSTFDVLKDFCMKFCAFAQVRFNRGIAYAYFRSKNNSSYIKEILNTDSFVGQAEIQPNWRFISDNGVAMYGQAIYYNGESLQDKFKYSSEDYDGETVGLTSTYIDKESPFVDIDFDTSIFSKGDRIQFSGHDSVYRVFSVDSASRITIKPKLTQSVKKFEKVFKYTDKNYSIELLHCFKYKLKYPDIYVACYGGGANGQVRLYYNDNSNGLITDYNTFTCADGNHDGIKWCQGVDLIPWKKESENVLGKIGMFQDTENAGNDDIYYFPLGFKTADVDNSDNSLRNQTSILCFASDVVAVRNETNNDVDYFLTIIYGNTVDEIYRVTVAMENKGGYNTDSGESAWYFRYPILESNVPSDVVRIYNGLSNDDIDGIFLHYQLWNPFYSNPVRAYFTKNNEVHYVDIYDYNVIYGTTTYETALIGSIAAGDLKQPWICPNSSGGQRIYVADYGNNKIYYDDNITSPTFVTYCGGGATSPAVGSSTSKTNLSMTNPFGVCQSYDGYVAISDNGNNKLLLVDDDTVYCIAGNGLGIDDPRNVWIEDFYGFWEYDDGTYKQPLNVLYSASENFTTYYSKDRRIVRASLRWQDIDYLDIGLGDRVALDSTVVANETYGQTIFWISKLVFNWETHEYDIEFLEDTDAQQGIGAMIIGQDNEVA